MRHRQYLTHEAEPSVTYIEKELSWRFNLINKNLCVCVCVFGKEDFSICNFYFKIMKIYCFFFQCVSHSLSHTHTHTHFLSHSSLVCALFSHSPYALSLPPFAVWMLDNDSKEFFQWKQLSCECVLKLRCAYFSILSYKLVYCVTVPLI